MPATLSEQDDSMPFTPTTFAVETSGTGRPVIFLPGFACGGREWDSTVEHLGGTAESHVVTLAGIAGVPPVAEPSLTAVHAELVRYVVGNELESPVIVGHSLGGTQALWLAESVPSLGGVVDVEGSPALPGTDDAFVAHLRSMTRDDLAAWIRQSMGGMFSRPGDRDRVLDESVTSDVATIAQMWGEGMALDLRAELGSIDAPVTVVVAVDPAAETERQLEPWRTQTAAIPDVELVPLSGRHFVMFDQPEEFHAVVDKALARAAR
jgi:pimeloyl-ACP methyl ester carboxylesterase